MPLDLPQKVEKAQVRSASPNQDASLLTSRIKNYPYPILRHVHLSPTYPIETEIEKHRENLDLHLEERETRNNIKYISMLFPSIDK